MAQQFIGRGWSYPVTTDNTGSIALFEGDRDVQRAMRLILGTAPGERPMRPEFGCGIHNYVFASADPTTAGLLSLEVKKSLKRWEPRVNIETVEVTVDDADRNVLYIDITYTHKGTYDRRNLVFPFYVIPEEA